MKHSRALFGCLITVAVMGLTRAAGQEYFFSNLHGEELVYHSANTLFDFAEQQHPEIFPGPEATQMLREGDGAPYWFYRYYAGTNTYLAVKWDFMLYVYGPSYGTEIIQLGNLIDVMDSVSPVKNPGSGECVDIGYPGEGTVASYSGNEYDDPVGSQITWRDGGNGLYLVQENFNSHRYPESNYQTMHWIVSTDGMDYIEQSAKTFTQPINDAYVGNDVYTTLRKSESTYDPGLLLGPTNRFCVGQRWYSPRVPESESFYSSLTGNPVFSQVQESQWSIGIVNSVNSVVTVPAGKFVTVETTVVRSWEVLTRWTDRETGVVVREMAYAPGIGHFFTELRRELQSITQHQD